MTRPEGCTCDLELHFLASDEGEVIDAECEVVAECREPRFAKLVAAALNAFQEGNRVSNLRGHSTVCLIHAEPHAAEEDEP